MRSVPAPGCLVPGPCIAARSGVPRGRSPLGCVQKDRSERVLRDGDELGKRPTYPRSTERNSRSLAYSSQYATFVCTNYAFHYSYRLRKRCTRNSARLICAPVDNPASEATSTRYGERIRAHCARAGLLYARSRFAARSGVPRGADLLGVSWGEAAKDRSARSTSLGNGQLPRALYSAIRTRLPIPRSV